MYKIIFALILFSITSCDKVKTIDPSSQPLQLNFKNSEVYSFNIEDCEHTGGRSCIALCDLHSSYSYNKKLALKYCTKSCLSGNPSACGFLFYSYKKDNQKLALKYGQLACKYSYADNCKKLRLILKKDKNRANNDLVTLDVKYNKRICDLNLQLKCL